MIVRDRDDSGDRDEAMFSLGSAHMTRVEPRTWRIHTVMAVVLALIASTHLVFIPAAEAQSVPELCENVPVAQRSPFTDVSPELYGADYIACMKHLGLTSGKGDGSFGRVDELTRAQMASFLAGFWRLASGRECPSGDTPFSDVAEGGSHYDGIICIYNLNITTGKTATLFDPDSSVTTAQLSLFLWRTYESLGGGAVACGSNEEDPFDHAVECLRSINVIPTEAEGRIRQPVIRAQVAVYMVGLWLHLTGRRVPHPPTRPTPADRSRALSYDYPNVPASDRSPDWSPDGTMLAFGEGWFGTDGLYVVTTDGKDRRKLADEGRDPAWHPDGGRLAFTRAGGLYVIGADGNGLRLTYRPPDIMEQSSVGNPTWSRDGKRLFFTAGTSVVSVPRAATDTRRFRSARKHLWVIDADGTNPVQLTTGDGIDPYGDVPTRHNIFTLSPDGRQVAFTSIDGIYRMTPMAATFDIL